MKKLLTAIIIVFIGAIAQAKEPVDAAKSRLMLIDVHSHLPRGLTLDQLRSWMKTA